MKRILLVLYFLLFLFGTSRSAQAANFTTSYNAVYTVRDDETTNVSLAIDLKNNTSDFYATSYRVQLGFRDVSNITGRDGGGPLEIKAEKNNQGTLLTFDFIRSVVGINNVQRFTINFDTKEIARKEGEIWEINIPAISNQEDFSNYSIQVNPPQGAGNPSLVKPQFSRLGQNGVLYFTKNELKNGGVSISYGKKQHYYFNLKYHLNNDNLFPVDTEIALPSDTGYQSVQIDKITPRPKNVKKDTDGNWLATYTLSPSQSKKIEVIGKLELSLSPRVETLSPEQRKEYLKEDKFWEANHAELKKLSNELNTPKKIYDYVVTNLKYDSSRVAENEQVRAGALGALAQKNSAVCLEFTDLFIALSRAAGIPARAVEGYANTDNGLDRPISFGDVLHAWPQYYDVKEKKWISVDPTWGNTTRGTDYFSSLDFNHVSFVIKGTRSDYPVPAGGYKLANLDTKDIIVEPINSFSKSLPKVTAQTDFQENYIGGDVLGGNLIVKNTGNVSSPNQTARISSQHGEKIASIPSIPPFGETSVPISLGRTSILTNKEETIKITIGNESISKTVYISPFYKNYFFLIGGLFIGSITGVLLFFIIKSRRVPVY